MADFKKLFEENRTSLFDVVAVPDLLTTGEKLLKFSAYFKIGIILTIVFCILSKVLSNKYAEMLGKE